MAVRTLRDGLKQTWLGFVAFVLPVPVIVTLSRICCLQAKRGFV